jgi:hypothetical protein
VSKPRMQWLRCLFGRHVFEIWFGPDMESIRVGCAYCTFKMEGAKHSE